METRSQKLFLIDHDESQISGAKLPPNGQVLRVLFYNMRKVKLLPSSSAKLIIKEVKVFSGESAHPNKKITTQY